MLDALKFAFEILIVGALALPWIELLYRMFPTPSSQNDRFNLSFVPKDARNVVAVAVVIGVGYLLGSAISRFSVDFFNDELWGRLPSQDKIRDSIYYSEFCPSQVEYAYWSQPIHLAPMDFCPKMEHPRYFSQLNQRTAELFDDHVQEVFRLEESELLLQGLDKVDRLKQYFDQITILRGAALNAVILFALALFGYFGQMKERWLTNKLVAWFRFIPAGSVTAYVVYSLIRHWAKGDIYRDPPLAETTLLLLSAVGLFAAWKPQRHLPYVKICTIAVVAMVMSFGGWWWTEMTYDLQVIHSLPEIKEKKIISIEEKVPASSVNSLMP
jgi:hypothetical protein